MAETRMCPDCGVAMNPHGSKVDVAAALEGRGPVDPVFGGVLLEAYACPACGKTRSYAAGS